MNAHVQSDIYDFLPQSSTITMPSIVRKVETSLSMPDYSDFPFMERSDVLSQIQALIKSGTLIQSDKYLHLWLNRKPFVEKDLLKDLYRVRAVTGIFWDKTTKARIDAVRAFLSAYTSTQDESALGIIDIYGTKYQIIDITLRMLTPRELFSAQGFPKGYIIDHILSGRMLTKEEQVRMVGNSVSPKVAEAIVKANVFSYSDIPFVEAA